MVPKQSHIKNPLTVIAIFAGLAELSGTAVLPALTPEVQKVYVWFLMIFPTALVGMFFLVLYLRHHVLYAPSDFRDDSGWLSLAAKKASLEKRVTKAWVEAAEEREEFAQSTGFSEDAVGYDSGGDQTAAEPSEATTVAQGNVAANVERVQSRDRRGMGMFAVKDLASNILEADSLIKTILARRLKQDWIETFPGLSPRLEFDAIFPGPPVSLVEVQYTESPQYGRNSKNRIFGKLQRALEFYENLAEEQRSGMKLYFCLACSGVSRSSMDDIELRIKRAAEGYPFAVQPMVEDINFLRTVAGRIAAVTER